MLLECSKEEERNHSEGSTAPNAGCAHGEQEGVVFFLCEKLGLPDSLALPVCQTPGSTRGMSKVLADNPPASSLPLRKSLCFEQWLQHEASAPC